MTDTTTPTTTNYKPGFFSIETVLGIMDRALDQKKKPSPFPADSPLRKVPVIKNCNKNKAITLSVVFAICTLIYLNKTVITQHIESFLIVIEAAVKNQMATSPVLGVLMILFFEVVFFNVPFPAVSVYNVLSVYIMQNFFVSWFIMVFCCVVSSFSTYFLMDKFCKNSVERAIENSRVLNLLIKKMEGKPYKMFFMIKMVALPELIRNIFLGAIGLEQMVMIKGNIMFYLILTLKYAVIGSEVRQIQDILKKPAAWSDKTLMEKLGFFLMSLIVIINIIFAGVLAVKIKQLVKEDDEKNSGTQQKGVMRKSSQEFQPLDVTRDEEDH